jgi:hypothetical protein
VNLEKFISFVTHHNEAIIQWLFFGILLLAGTLIARSIFGKKEEVSQNQTTGNDLHSALEKILAQTTKLESISVDKLSAPSNPQAEAAVAALKVDLAVREKELAELKAKGGSENSDATAGLSARIKELESKLSEYEILEDDIADLSLYKEENSRLKSELDRVKGGAGGEILKAAAPKGDDIVAEFAQAVVQKTSDETATEVSSVAVPQTGNPMADFEQTVQLGKKMASEPTAVAAAPAPAAAQEEADDIFAEFSQEAPENGGASLDTDKMMAEMAALVSMEPSPSSSLEESIDTDKMAAEATSFEKS